MQNRGLHLETVYQQTYTAVKKNKTDMLTSVSGFLSPRHGASSGCVWRNGFQYGG